MEILENIRPPSRINFPGITESGYRYLQAVAEWINNNAGWVNRPAVAANDFGIPTIVPDATWRTLDLSSIVPEQARAVYLKLKLVSGPTIGHNFKIRQYGEGNVYNSVEQETQVDQQEICISGIVAISRNRLIEYKGANTADWDNIYITILGWFI